MFVGEAPYIKEEFQELKHCGWMGILNDPGVGSPRTLSYAPHLTGNIVHQAYHLRQWEQATGLSIGGITSVAEFGGGYGAMALVMDQLGFRGRYVIYDLPALGEIQRWYLHKVGVHAETATMADLKCDQFDLALSVTSLSEAPIYVRDDFFNHIQARHHLHVFQKEFEGIDNKLYFEDLFMKKAFKSPTIKSMWYIAT